MNLKPIQFISEDVEVFFEVPPLLEKKPGCPDGFIWREERYAIQENLSEWRDFNRRGRMAHSMRPANLKKAARRGSVGVGRFYFRVRVGDGRIFDLYYDRAVKNADERKGSWTLHQELGEK
ncbi:MAG: DUF6504 family protein [Anaerolineales bacterium]|nr:DUF6504 family protein [Anaerolineales bacterium]